ncbi:MAG: hypothetical protein V1899_02065 [Planctomycetota bacterium]
MRLSEGQVFSREALEEYLEKKYPDRFSMVHKVIQTNLDSSLGCVIPADLLYFDSADKLLQSRILPRKVHEKTMKWIKGSPDQQLVSALEQHPLVMWRDRIDALPGRFDRAREMAARSLEPETQTVDIPRRMLKSPEDVDVWVKEVHEKLKAAIAKGPVII